MTKQICFMMAIISLIAFWGTNAMADKTEEAKYTVVETHDRIEIRDYAPKIIAQAKVTGDRREAANKGFRILADYIFGNNISKQDVAMTAPVIQKPSEKIAMTAPVIQEENDGLWTIQFVMPAQYTIRTLPMPNNDAIEIVEMPVERFATIRFSGWVSQGDLDKYTKKLQKFVLDNKLEPLSDPVYAFYNPPWTLPFLRRNEVLIKISQ